MHGKKILITGANGMLGSGLLEQLTYNEIVGFTSQQLDITNSQQVQSILNSEKPDFIIHTAAFTNVEQSEIDEDTAYLVNTIGTQNLVNYCINKDVLFIYISSTGIYGKEKENTYTEFDSVCPTTVHHNSKYEAEKVIQNHLSKYLILRTGWLFGGKLTHTKNFVYKRYLEALNNKMIYSDDAQIGNPTSIKYLISQIQVLIDENQFGTFNCINKAESVSRYDYVKKIIELFGLDCKVEKAPKGMFERIASVSHNESAINYKLDLLGINVMNQWDVALSEYIKYLKKKI